MRLPVSGFAAVLIALFSTAGVSASPLYNLTDFGAAIPRSINNNGDVALPEGVFHSYGPDAGQVTPPSAYGIGSNATITAINDSDQLVGYTMPSDQSTQSGFVSEGGNAVQFPNSPNLQFSTANAINNSGDVVGDSIHGEVATGYLLHDGKLIDLGTSSSTYVNTYPTAISDSGQVTGQTSPASWAPHAFLYSDGKMVDLGTLGGATSTGTGINNQGQVVGYSLVAGSQTVVHAFLYSGGKMSELGTLPGPIDLTLASAINNSGQIVGTSSNLATLWQSGRIYDLNQLLNSAPPGTVLNSTTGINDAGQIIGIGYDGHGQSGFLLTPVDLAPPASFIPVPQVPEPATFLIFAVMSGGLLLYRRGTSRVYETRWNR